MPKVRNKKWTDPKISPQNLTKSSMKKTWYIHFRYYSYQDNKWKQKKISADLNDIKNFTSRKKAAVSLRDVIHEELERDWNPDTGLYNRTPELVSENFIFYDAIKFSFSKKKETLREKSIHTYKGITKILLQAIVKTRMQNKLVNDIKRRDIKLLLDEMSKIFEKNNGRKVSGHAYNKYLNIISILFNQLEEYEYVEYNPCSKIKKRTEIKTDVHRIPTPEEIELIKKHLSTNQPNFYKFVSLIYETGIRITELRQIKLEYIDWKKQEIVLPAEIGKTKKIRRIPLTNKSWEWIIQLQLLPKNYYLFSDDYAPGPRELAANNPNKRWRKIKDKLDIACSLYSMKALGGEDKIEAGIPVQAVSVGYGHSSLDMTVNHYTKKQRDRWKEILKTQSPSL